ncbi:DEAD/DEAH box helicase [Saccharomonospora xinjiangensis]|uniref:DNA2/NAM7 helicase-like C-terminal domain-containing protein n=1 Tax=Saccharomonospora xinjiangensis XJ-54 TaxID=882086 RepID=I0UWW6_9PSEU|nr:ATP-binding protein [Saccharomonospora xinjiangensis]EID52369.1 hypothetical protein SacxiDRAFT_0084 [Saccharomonospora xinjiangensis XJ-54]
MFSPQKVEEVNREQLVFAVRPGQPLPWEPGHELASRSLKPGKAWRHVVYLGIYRLDEAFEILSRVFGPDPESYDERPAGESAIAAFIVGEDGRALLGSEVLSSCAWAAGQVLREKPAADWVAKFENASSNFGAAWREVVAGDLFARHDEGLPPQPRVLGSDDLAECLATAVAVTGAGHELSCAEIRISSQIVDRQTAKDAGGHDFLNSLIMSDLGLVAEQVAQGNAGPALREYLRPDTDIRISERIDVRERFADVLATTAPDNVAAGRWPNQPEHALTLNQQVAVSTALTMAGPGIMGVNGPPGTGKTTMLRDLIAGIVVERAQRLARISQPKRAFTHQKLRWKTGQFNRVVSVWQPELTGFEIVVASSNNGAVQNVTDEIPAANAIGRCWKEEAAALDYFSDIASALLAPQPERQRSPSPVVAAAGWAAVAARLGNKSNRNRFVKTFWYHTPDRRDDADSWFGMLSTLKRYEQSSPARSWKEAVEDFRTADARVETLRAARSAVYERVQRRAQLIQELKILSSAVSNAAEHIKVAYQRRDLALSVERERQDEANRIARARQAEDEEATRRRRDDAERLASARTAELERLRKGRWAGAQRAVRSAEAEVSRRRQLRATHQETRPGLWKRLGMFSPSVKRWARHDSWLEGEIHAAQHELTTAMAELDSAQRELDAVERDVDATRRELHEATQILNAGVPVPHIVHKPLLAAQRDRDQAELDLIAAVRHHAEAEAALHTEQQRLADLDEELARATVVLGKHCPDTDWWQDRQRRETAALWTDPEWNTARSELFLAALTLHKSFLHHAATEMRRNLHAAMDIISGSAPHDIPEEAALAAWQSFFFVVPVVSTTFASYARLFAHLGREALGWLLIDEAGQATPQNAVGALWRTKRVVAVGDPLQLEPVTTLPFRAEQAIRKECGADEQWSPSRTSVQRIADRLTVLGTWLPSDDGETWVGVPLTVHRRCDQPMFDIVNSIAYDGLMIHSTGHTAGEKFTATYPTLPESKWIDVVSENARNHWVPDEGRQLDRILRVLHDLDFDMSEVMVIAPFRDVARQLSGRTKRYPGLVAGTIHTAQGKQADIVVVVLGSDPARPGARRWAASKPNLLNVAVSRAKRRLYVIGDRNAWSSQRHFETLAARLPHTTPIDR